MSGKEQAASRVVALNEDNFKAYVNADRNTFVLYTVPWSRECQRVDKIWDSLSISQSKKHFADIVTIAKVDAKKYPQLARKMGVKAYPTLMYYTPEEPEGMEYNGLREMVLLESFIFQMT